MQHPLPLEKAMRLPSGAQLGALSASGGVGLVTGCGAEPSELTVQIAPADTNAMRPFSPGYAASAGTLAASAAIATATTNTTPLQSCTALSQLA